MSRLVILCFIFLLNGDVVLGQLDISIEDLTVLENSADTMMQSYLTNLVDKQFAVRDSLLGTLKTASDWDEHTQTIRDSLASWTGPFPDRTPLKGRVTGRIERDGYTVEKILFESRPGYLVSANLYLPADLSSPRPAHLNLIGHSQFGKADERYQRMSIALARSGFVVLTIDQIGQGERGKLSSHKIIGTQAFISGTHLFNFMVWDAIRAIDYLESRPEVDSENICLTGSSGGGMMTTYILPFDDRIKVAVPTCNPNTWSDRVHANLATDHEQVFFGAFESSIDPRGDPLFAQVPNPLMLNTTTDDPLNPVRGVWALNTWLYKAYAAHNAPEKLTTTMVKAGHAYNREQRELTFAWMRRWTGNESVDFWEQDTPLESEQNLWATSTGSVFEEPGSTGPKDLILEYLEKNRADLEEPESPEGWNRHKTTMAALVSELLHIDAGDISNKGKIDKTRVIGDGLELRSFVVEPEQGIVLPGVMLEPISATSESKVVLYLSEKGKSNILKNLDVITDILSRGYRICAVDLRGIGETSPDLTHKFWDFLSGKPIFGQRVKDVLSVIQWLKGPDLQADQIKLWGEGMCGLYGAFAGVFTDDIDGFVIEKPLISFESVVQVDVPAYQHEVILPGILEQFDMTQVYQALCPRPVTVLNPLSGDKEPAGNDEFKRIEKEVLRTYQSMNSPGSWSLQKADFEQRKQDLSSRLIDN